jgi:predicted amidophosphoribosyltransferase
MAETAKSAQQSSTKQSNDALYCPNCAREITDPLTCGDCSAVICRVCGTPLESSADLGMG